MFQPLSSFILNILYRFFKVKNDEIDDFVFLKKKNEELEKTNSILRNKCEGSEKYSVGLSEENYEISIELKNEKGKNEKNTQQLRDYVDKYNKMLELKEKEISELIIDKKSKSNINIKEIVTYNLTNLSICVDIFKNITDLKIFFGRFCI